MRQYLDLLQRILDTGVDRPDRTGTGTRAVFGATLRFDLAQGFPLLTTKSVHFRSVAEELLWFLSGSTNVRPLRERKVTIWDEWADADGDLGPVYGAQWRSWRTFVEDPVATGLAGDGRKRYVEGEPIDQITELVERLNRDPYSRRHLVSAWNVGELDDMALAPCHSFFQPFVADGRISLKFFMRSVDTFLGLPFNVASYALLTHMLAQQTNLEVGELEFTATDVHLYHNHFDQARTQLARAPRALPRLEILRRPNSILGYRYEDFRVVGYDPCPAIKAPVAV